MSRYSEAAALVERIRDAATKAVEATNARALVLDLDVGEYLAVARRLCGQNAGDFVIMHIDGAATIRIGASREALPGVIALKKEVRHAR